MTGVETLTDLAVRLKMSSSWTQKHWREVPGLPAPFIGAGKHERPRWRTADLDRFFGGNMPAGAPAAQAMAPQALATAPRPAAIPQAEPEDTGPKDAGMAALLRAAGA